MSSRTSESPSPDGGRRSLLLVAGSGRSGTSLFTGLTSRLGFHIPQPEIKANEANPHGHGEPKWALGFHKQLMRSLAISHDDARPGAWELADRVADRADARRRLAEWLTEQFGESSRVVIKDPRLSWFVELYRTVASELSADVAVVTMLRHPAETVRSKQMAYGSGLDVRTRMASWLNLMLFVEYRTRRLPRAIIGYDDVLMRWQEALAAAERSLPFSLVGSAHQEQLDNADDLVDASLRRSHPAWDDLALPPTLQELAMTTYDALSAQAIRVDPTGSDDVLGFTELDEARRAYTQYYADAEAVVRSSITAARTKERRRVGRELPSSDEDGDGHGRRGSDHRLTAAVRARAAGVLRRARS